MIQIQVVHTYLKWVLILISIESVLTPGSNILRGKSVKTMSSAVFNTEKTILYSHYCKNPENSTMIEFEVMTLADWSDFGKNEKLAILSRVLRLDQDPKPTVLLDIDEDYFSTIDPMAIIAAYRLRENEDMAKHMQILLDHKTYCAASSDPEDIKNAISKLTSGISRLFKYALDLSHGITDWFDQIKNLLDVWCDGREAAEEYFSALYAYWAEAEEDQQGALMMPLVAALPHYIANQTEIEEMVHDMEEMLRIIHGDLAVPKPPVVTIARSLKDDYTPPSLWPFIEIEVLNLLSRVYETKEK